MAQNNSNNDDDLDDPAFRTQKLPGGSVKVENMLNPPKSVGTEDKRVKAMEEAVHKAKSKQKLPGVSTEDAYSVDEAENKKSTDHQKVTNTVKLKRAKETPDNEPDSTLKLKRTKSDDELSADPAPLLGWQHWAFLILSVLLTITIVYLLMTP